jgi:hypothetical protein
MVALTATPASSPHPRLLHETIVACILVISSTMPPPTISGMVESAQTVKIAGTAALLPEGRGNQYVGINDLASIGSSGDVFYTSNPALVDCPFLMAAAWLAQS